MIGTLLEKLFVSVGVDLSDLNGELSKATGKVAADTKRMSASFSGVSKGVGDTQRSLVRASSAAGKLRMEQSFLKAKTDQVTASTRGATAATNAMAASMKGAAVSSGIARHHMANLSFQAVDVAQGFAMGLSPMQVFMQQGFQIGQIMGQAQIGVGGLAKAVGGMVVRFAAAHPILLATAAGVGVAAVAFRQFAENVNATHRAELDAYTASLGLTAEQIEEAGGAAVTAGDMIGGLWDIIKEAVSFEALFANLKNWIADNIEAAALSAKKNLSEIYAAASAAVDGIKHVWKNIGPIIGDGVISGVNVAIAAIESLINRAIDGINKLMVSVSPVLRLAKMAGVDVGIPHIQFDRVDNAFEGAGKSAADAFTGAYRRRLEEAEGAFDRFFDRWGEAGIRRRNERLGRAAAEAAAEAAGGSSGSSRGRSDREKELSHEERFAQWREFNKNNVPSVIMDMPEMWKSVVPPMTEVRNILVEMPQLLTQTQQELAYLGENIGRDIMFGLSVVLSGRLSFKDFIRDLFSNFLYDVISSSLRNIETSLFGERGLGGFLGNLFTGLVGGFQSRAVGGPTVPGGVYNVGVGEKLVTSQHGRILSRSDAMEAMGGGDRVFRFIVDKSDYFDARVEEISGRQTGAAMAKYDRVIGSRVHSNLNRRA